nr:immunoglobulin heavy chain junction region [Macaca mulatta]
CARYEEGGTTFAYW